MVERYLIFSCMSPRLIFVRRVGQLDWRIMFRVWANNWVPNNRINFFLTTLLCDFLLLLGAIVQLQNLHNGYLMQGRTHSLLALIHAPTIYGSCGNLSSTSAMITFS